MTIRICIWIRCMYAARCIFMFCVRCTRTFKVEMDDGESKDVFSGAAVLLDPKNNVESRDDAISEYPSFHHYFGSSASSSLKEKMIAESASTNECCTDSVDFCDANNNDEYLEKMELLDEQPDYIQALEDAGLNLKLTGVEIEELHKHHQPDE